MQQRCHHASASARSPSWPPMPRPRLQRAATARREKVQLRIREQSFFSKSRVLYRKHLLSSNTCRRVKTQNQCKMIKRHTHTPIPPREQLFHRYCSNKHTHTQMADSSTGTSGTAGTKTVDISSKINRRVPDKTHIRQQVPELRGVRTGANGSRVPDPPPRGHTDVTQARLPAALRLSKKRRPAALQRPPAVLRLSKKSPAAWLPKDSWHAALRRSPRSLGRTPRSTVW